MKVPSKPSIELRLSVLSAVEHAEGRTIRERIKNTAKRTFVDHNTQEQHQFTWRTISTWLYRYKKNGVISMDNKTRRDKNTFRKIQPNELAEAIKEVLPTLRRNKTNKFVKSTLYRQLLNKNLITRKQLAPTTFYRMIREHDLLDQETTKQLRLSFCMQYANELWQRMTCMDALMPQAQDAQERPRCMALRLSNRMARGKRPS